MPASRSYNIGQPKDVPVDAITITVTMIVEPHMLF